MVEKKDGLIDYEEEKIWSDIWSIKESLYGLQKEFDKQKNYNESPTNVDLALSQLTQNVFLKFDYESAKLEQILQKHPELSSLMNSVAKKNAQKENNETIDTDLLQQEKTLLFDLLNSILASLNKQIDEERVRWYTFEATNFYKKIPLINTIFEFLAKKAQM